MKLYAVAFNNAFENELTIEFHSAADPVTAAMMHSKAAAWSLESLPKELEALKEALFDGDCLLAVEEVPASA